MFDFWLFYKKIIKFFLMGFLLEEKFEKSRHNNDKTGGKVEKRK